MEVCKIVGWYGGGEGVLFVCLCFRAAWNFYYFKIIGVINSLGQKDASTLGISSVTTCFSFCFFLMGILT